MLLTRQNARGGRYGAAHPPAWLGDPINLTATGSVSPGSAGKVNALAFRPPSQKRGMVISAIKFQVQPAVVGTIAAAFTNYNVGQGFQLGSVVAVSFSLMPYRSDGGLSGALPIGAFSNRVPINILCDSRDISSDLIAGGFNAAGTGAAFNAIHPISEYRWDLPEPFYVPPGWILVPDFFGQGGNISGNVGQFGGTLVSIPELQVQVTYEASLIDIEKYDEDSDYTDDVVRLPFACCWTPTPFGPSTPYNAVSDETNLVNVYDEPAYVTKINGKLLAYPELNDSVFDSFSLLVRMVAGNQIALVRDLSPFREVFDRQTRCWDVEPLSGKPYSLAPGEAVIATLNCASVPVALATANVQPQIGLTGYREIPRSALEGSP